MDSVNAHTEFNGLAEVTRKALVATDLVPPTTKTPDKITVVGAGQVGIATAVSLLMQGVSSNVALIDVAKDRVTGEMLDLQHGSLFMENARIVGSEDYAESAGSRVVIITAGVAQKEGETRLALVQRNVNIMKCIIPQVVKYSPEAILLIVANPCDVLTYVAWKLSNFPPNRIIGAGTNLDSARFRYLISRKLGVAAGSCHGYIIGEHGDSSVPCWSSVNVAGVRLRELNPAIGKDDDPDNWASLHEHVVKSAYEIIKLKGYTNWAIGLSCANICKSILHNTYSVHPLSVNVKEYLGLDYDVFLSLPCVLGQNGISSVINLDLHGEEREQIIKSAQILHDIIKDGIHGITEDIFAALPTIVGSQGVYSIIEQSLDEDEKDLFKKSCEGILSVQKGCII